MQETITALDALLGTDRVITTPYGTRVKLAIPSGTQPGEKLRLRGKGVDRGDRKGDLYVEVNVTVPTLTDAQRDALREAAQQAGAHLAGPAEQQGPHQEDQEHLGALDEEVADQRHRPTTTRRMTSAVNIRAR